MMDRFVGRVDETTRAIARLDRAFGGDGALLVFRGEAGIGKTRLAERTVMLAKERGARIAWGRAWEEGGAEARAREDVAGVLPKIAREGQVLSLRRLSEAEVATGATDETVRAVYGMTEGNPLFVQEVLWLGAFSETDVPDDVRAI